MYREFYRLSDEPFRVTPDPDFLFLAPQYKEALAAIVYGIAKRKGFVCITGEVGVGKTTILRSYLNTVEDQALTFVYVFNPKVSFAILMRTILRDLGQPTQGEVPELVERLHEHLITCYRAKKTVVLFVDEAQNMPMETIENLRMLSNLETSTDKLIQIILVGQPELDELLSRPQLRQLKTRIVVRAKLGPLGKADSLAYIRHRLNRVACDDRAIFTDRAMGLIIKEARGIPRIINILCDAALITGFGYRVRPIPPKVVREVIRDTFGSGQQRISRRWIAGAGLAAAAFAGVGLWLAGPDGGHRPGDDPIADLIISTEKTGIPAEKGRAAAPAKAGERHTASAKASSPPASPPVRPEAAAQGSESPQAFNPADEAPDAGSDLVRLAAPLPKRSPPPPAATPVPPAEPPQTEARAQLEPPNPPGAGSPEIGPGRRASAQEAPPSGQPEPPPKSGSPKSWPPVSEPPVSEPPVSGQGRLRSVKVKPGDTLSKLSQDVYGTADTGVLGQLQRANPNITDIDRLYVGQVISFPPLAEGTSGDQEAALRKPR